MASGDDPTAVVEGSFQLVCSSCLSNIGVTDIVFACYSFQEIQRSE